MTGPDVGVVVAAMILSRFYVQFMSKSILLKILEYYFSFPTFIIKYFLTAPITIIHLLFPIFLYNVYCTILWPTIISHIISLIMIGSPWKLFYFLLANFWSPKTNVFPLKQTWHWNAIQTIIAKAFYFLAEAFLSPGGIFKNPIDLTGSGVFVSVGVF